MTTCTAKRLDAPAAIELLEGAAETALSKALLPALKTLPRTAGTVAHLAEYRFGDMVWNAGRFTTPCAARHSSPCVVCADLANSTTTIPLTLVLSGRVEIASAVGTLPRYAPLRVVRTGDAFGVFETLDSLGHDTDGDVAPWHISAGSRGARILTPERGLERELKKRLRIRHYEAPHWAILRRISDHIGATDGRPCVLPGARVLILRPSVATTILHESDAAKLALYVVGWNQAAYSRSLRIVESVDAARFFSRQHADTHVTKAGFRYASITHLRAVLSGYIPAMVPVGTDPDRATFWPVQTFLADEVVTRSASHYPHLLVPAHINESSTTPVYYSLRICPLPLAFHWDFDDTRSNPPKYSRDARDLAREAGELLADAATVDAIAGTSHTSEATWTRVDADFGTGPVYRGDRFWTGCLRVVRSVSQRP